MSELKSAEIQGLCWYRVLIALPEMWGKTWQDMASVSHQSGDMLYLHLCPKYFGPLGHWVHANKVSKLMKSDNLWITWNPKNGCIPLLPTGLDISHRGFDAVHGPQLLQVAANNIHCEFHCIINFHFEIKRFFHVNSHIGHISFSYVHFDLDDIFDRNINGFIYFI